MRFQTTQMMHKTVLGLVLALLTSGAVAQNYYPPSPMPPDLGFVPGAPSGGAVEYVNPVAGNLNLSFPVAKLPSGPGGFAYGVNLTYNSAFYSQYTDDYIHGTGQLRIEYQNQPTNGSQTGTLNAGGWAYSFRYLLWSACEPPDVTLPGCTTYLTTPDGANHALVLVSVLNTAGAPLSTSFHTNHPSEAVYDADFSGTCHSSDAVCVVGFFSGTLVFASADGTFIRLESDTVGKTWVAYLADGTQISGNFNPPGNNIGAVLAAEWNKIQDRNGNTVQLSNFCLEANPCTTTINDKQGRTISIEYGNGYGSQGLQTWTDTITQPGVNGNIQTLINWAPYNFTGPSYDCIYPPSNGSYGQCQLTAGSQATTIAPLVVTSIQLPSGTGSGTTSGPSTVYFFKYDAPQGYLTWGELHGMTRKSLASGVDITACSDPNSTSCTQQYEVDYTYHFDTATNHRYMGTLVNPVATRTLNYQENRDGTKQAVPPEITTYTIPVPASFDPTKPTPTGGTSTIQGPDGRQTVYTSAPQCSNNLSGFCSALVGHVLHADGTQTSITWASNTAYAPTGAPSGAFTNPYAYQTTLSIGGKAKGRSITVDSNGNTISLNEYDWFTASDGIPSSPTRATSFQYYSAGLNYWTHGTSPNLRALKSSTAGTVTTSYDYDNRLTTANLTQQTLADSTSNTSISRSWTYTMPDGITVNGNVVTATDPNQVVTKILYDSANLYPVEVDQALNLTEQRTFKPISYDSNSGLLSSSTDADNHLKTTYTYDNIGRQIKVEQKQTNAPSGTTAADRSTSTNYDDVGMSVTNTQDQTGLASSTYYDPLGRVRLITDPAGNRVQKAYRAGSGGATYELESNPYISAAQITGWSLTTRTQNSSGASTTLQTFSGPNPPSPWGNGTPPVTGTATTTAFDLAMTNCFGPTTNVTDEANYTTKYCHDGLGRLVAVTDPLGNLTEYAYDFLDNVTKVTQAGGIAISAAINNSATTIAVSSGSGISNNDYIQVDGEIMLVTAGGGTTTLTVVRGQMGTTATSHSSGENIVDTKTAQTRAFEYALNRLMKACNPETGTASCTTSPLAATGLESYTYDNNGNVKTKTDTRSVKTTYTNYDGFNRPQSITYTKSDGSAEGTPTVSYTYDQDWKGALSSVGTSVGSSVYSTSYTHDTFGRVSSSTQTTGAASNTFTFPSYSYSAADELQQIQYPSGRIVTYTNSGGLVTGVSNGRTNASYASPITYTPAGGISSLTLGNQVVESYTWNDRQQPTGLTVAPVSGQNHLVLKLYPCASLQTSCQTGNVGNIQTQTISAPAVNLNLTHTYNYDALNRITGAVETPGSFSQTYGYDANANWYLSTNNDSKWNVQAFTPRVPSNFDANNRLSVDNSAFDPSGNGNQMAIGGSGGYSYSYDAENRITTANQGGNGAYISSTGYVYDGEGQRVQKITCPLGTLQCTPSVTGATVSTTYVYDAFGNLAAEYGTPQSPCGTPTCYLSVDHLGSTRLVTDSNGDVTGRYDFLPFGEELWGGTGGRTTDMKYRSGPDGFSPKFTGQMRDTESRLDYFNARYYSPEQGRFMSADPENAGAEATDPQTWNGYSYVANNPLNYTDPSGEGFWSGLVDVLGSFFGIWGQWPGLNVPNGIPGGGGADPLGTIGGGDPWSEQLPSGPLGIQDLGPFGINNAQAGTIALPQAGPRIEAPRIPWGPTWAPWAVDTLVGLLLMPPGRAVFIITVTAKPLNQSEIYFESPAGWAQRAYFAKSIEEDNRREAPDKTKRHKSNKRKWDKHSGQRAGRQNTKDRENPKWKSWKRSKKDDPSR